MQTRQRLDRDTLLLQEDSSSEFKVDGRLGADGTGRGLGPLLRLRGRPLPVSFPLLGPHLLHGLQGQLLLLLLLIVLANHEFLKDGGK